MTPTEVISEAYKRSISTNLISTTDIEATEFKYIRPALTENLYNYIVANSGSYSTLLTTYLKPCLAYFVKFETFDEIDVEISDRGVNKLINDDTNKISDKQRHDIKSSILDRANLLLEKMIDYVKAQYVDNNTLYTLYNDFSDVQTETKIVGGILIQGNNLNYENQWNLKN